jgi:hypothetical protein
MSAPLSLSIERQVRVLNRSFQVGVAHGRWGSRCFSPFSTAFQLLHSNLILLYITSARLNAIGLCKINSIIIKATRLPSPLPLRHHFSGGHLDVLTVTIVDNFTLLDQLFPLDHLTIPAYHPFRPKLSQPLSHANSGQPRYLTPHF